MNEWIKHSNNEILFRYSPFSIDWLVLSANHSSISAISWCEHMLLLANLYTYKPLRNKSYLSPISRFGCPLELHSDQGKNVDGNLIRQLCNLLEISKTRTTAYHPASNGQVERYNRLILQFICCFLKKTQNKWDVHLQQLAGVIRSTDNRQTGQTPNFLVGRFHNHWISC